MWRPFALSKEKVTGGVGLLNLLHFAKDTAQQTNRVLPLLVDENIHYRIPKLLYGAKNQRWNMRAYLRYVPSPSPSPTQPLGCDHYRLLGHSVLDALIDQKTSPTNQLKRKLDAVVGRRTDMDADRQEVATRNVRQRLR